MSESVADKGYRDTTVADVVRIARTSRRSFYEHFDDRDACYLALFDAVNDALMAEVAAAVKPEEPVGTSGRPGARGLPRRRRRAAGALAELRTGAARAWEGRL